MLKLKGRAERLPGLNAVPGGSRCLHPIDWGLPCIVAIARAGVNAAKRKIGMRAGGSEMPLTPENVKEGKHFIHMDGPKVWENAIAGMDDAIKNAIRLAGMTGDDIDFVVTHQANLRMIEVIMKNAGKPMDKTHTTVQKYGNTSSGTIGTALDEAVRMGKVKPGDNVALAGIGAGYTWGGTVIRWTCSP